MKRYVWIVLILLGVLAVPAYATDFDDTDQLYGWDTSTGQFWQTWSAHKTQLSLLYQGLDSDLTIYAGITPSADVQTMLGSANNTAIRSNIGAEATLSNEAGLYSALSDVSLFYEPGDTVQTGSATSLPGTCTVGDMYIDTDADTDGTLYICVATDTWKDVDDDGGAGGTPGGADTQIQYNNDGTFAGIASVIYDDVNLEIEDDFKLAFGTDADWFLVYDETNGDIFSIQTTKTGLASTDDAMVTIAADTGNSGMTANQEVFEVGKGGAYDGDGNFVELFSVDEDGDVTAAGVMCGRCYMATYGTAHSLTVKECSGGMIYVTASVTLTLPSLENAEGMNLTIMTRGDVTVSVAPQSQDKIVLDGVSLDDGDKITNLSTSGDIVKIYYYNYAGWCADSRSRISPYFWSDGGP